MTAIPRRRSAAFSLLEMVVVLAALALIVGLAAPAVIRQAGVGAERRLAQEITAALLNHRLDAIRAGRPVDIRLAREGEMITLEAVGADEPARAWPGAGLVPLDASGEPAERLELVFDARGRANRAEWSLRSEKAAGRIWRIAFDPVGGVPTFQQDTEAPGE